LDRLGEMQEVGSMEFYRERRRDLLCRIKKVLGEIFGIFYPIFNIYELYITVSRLSI
jgi:hypothetical protein